MGCLQSKRGPGSHSIAATRMVFRVTNIDENGRDLSSGQLQVTDSDIILYRQGHEMTLWPLHSLRRYGYEAGIFSFESGRRCETGEGIYAFRCRKAALLFHVLQEQIQVRNSIHEEEQRALRVVSTDLPEPEADDDNGPTAPNPPMLDSCIPPTIIGQPPRLPPDLILPSGAANNSITPLCPEFEGNVSKREHNNNRSLIPADQHVYCNDLNRDLAILRSALHQETELNKWLEIEEETQFLNNIGKDRREANNKNIGHLSPTLSNTSESYSQFAPEQAQESRMYMNLNTSVSISWALVDMNRNSPATPTTPKVAEYSNLSVKAEPNTYANLALRDVADTRTHSKHALQCDATACNPKVSESDTATSMSPLEDLEVNYAVLDIDSNKDSTKSVKDLVSPDRSSVGSSKNESMASGSSAARGRGRLASQPSLEAAPPAAAPSLGYTTIDFNKTVALTSVAAGAGAATDSDGSRKTRHNSTNIVCSSPTSGDKNKVFL